MEIYIIGIGFIAGMCVMLSVDLMLWSSFTLSMVVVGLAVMIMPSAGLLRWAVTMLSFVMFMVAIGRLLIGRTEWLPRNPLPLNLLYAFIIISIIGAGLNFNPQEWFFAAKNYFQFWSIPLVYIYLLKNEKTPTKLAYAMLILAAAQPLIAILQFFLLRGTAFVGDRIGGTFGSGLGVIGGNAELAMFQVTQLFVVFALIKYRLMKFSTGVVISAWFLLPLYWTATKAVIVMIPLGIVALYIKDMRHRPVMFVGVLTAAVVFSGILTYASFSSVKDYYLVSEYAPETFEEFVEDSISYNVEDKGERNLNRTSAILYWWDEHSITKNPLATLLGHGLGAAKMSGQKYGRLYYTTEYRGRSLGVTLLARLLWEVGIIGSIIYLWMFIALFVLAGRLASDAVIPILHRAILSGYQSAVLIFIISIPYKKSLVNSQAFAAYSMFLFGYILFWHRYQRQMKLKSESGNVVKR